MKCKNCWYFKRQFPFDWERGKFHTKWAFCAYYFRYLHDGKILQPVPKLIKHVQRLFPIDRTLFVESWQGTYRWKPFDSETCKQFLSQEQAVKILLSEK